MYATKFLQDLRTLKALRENGIFERIVEKKRSLGCENLTREDRQSLN